MSKTNIEHPTSNAEHRTCGQKVVANFVVYLFGVSAWPNCSADFQSAVSPNCIRQSVGSVPRAGVCQRLAEWNSAIQQLTTLRHDGALNRDFDVRCPVFSVRCFLLYS